MKKEELMLGMMWLNFIKERWMRQERKCLEESWQSVMIQIPSSSDDDIEDDTYVPSPQAQPHGKGVASASGSGAGRNDEIEEQVEEGDDDDGGEEEEVFDVEEINPPNYVDMRPLVLRAPTNTSWRVKVSYKGKTEFVRENRRILARTQPWDAYDYRFHSLFQQDFYKSTIMTKSKQVANSQWIDWIYMENKHGPIFDGVIAACQAKHLRETLTFKKD
jgi:hypothetical protein